MRASNSNMRTCKPKTRSTRKDKRASDYEIFLGNQDQNGFEGKCVNEEIGFGVLTTRRSNKVGEVVFGIDTEVTASSCQDVGEAGIVASSFGQFAQTSGGSVGEVDETFGAETFGSGDEDIGPDYEVEFTCAASGSDEDGNDDTLSQMSDLSNASSVEFKPIPTTPQQLFDDRDHVQSTNGSNDQSLLTFGCPQSRDADGPQSTDEDSPSIKVMRTHNAQGKRKWDKGAYCPFCQTYHMKLPRHLKESKAHKKEPQVAQWQATTDPKLKDRRLTKMRNLGNYLHNARVLQMKKGTIIPVYRPNYEADYRHYLPCSDCRGYFAKGDLWKHDCKLRKETPPNRHDVENEYQPRQKKRRRDFVRLGRCILPTTDTSDTVCQLYAGLGEDEDGVARFIKSDNLMKKLAEKLTFKFGEDKEQFPLVRAKLREVGRMVLAYRKQTRDKNASLADLIHPRKFSDVITATRHAAGFDANSHLFCTPILAVNIGRTMKKAAGILLGEAISNEDESLEIRAEAFIKLCELNWDHLVSANAQLPSDKRKRNNPKYLPVTSDIVKLTSYLKTQVEQVKITLNTHDNCSDQVNVADKYRELAELTLTSVLVFNRKRSGEVSKMKLCDYEKCKKGGDGITLEGLSKWEKELCKVVWRTEIIWKRARTVPVLLTEDMKQSMDLLKNKRRLAGVLDENPFMFPLLKTEGHMRGCNVLRKHAGLCGASKPEYLRSTSLRKHIGIVAQVMNLKENERDILARFMGHDIRVYREFCHPPEQTLQLAKVSKVLLQMEKGDLASLAGSSLDEIQIEEDEEVPLDEPLHRGGDVDGDETLIPQARKQAPRPHSSKAKGESLTAGECKQEEKATH